MTHAPLRTMGSLSLPHNAPEPEEPTMAQQTKTAFFDSYDAAAKAVRRLEATGIPHDRISLVANNPTRPIRNTRPAPSMKRA